MYITQNTSIISTDSFIPKTNHVKKECNKPSENKDYTNNIMMVLPMQNENLKSSKHEKDAIQVLFSFPEENKETNILKQEVNVILRNALHDYLKKIS